MSENCSFRIKHKAKTLFSSVGDRTVELYNFDSKAMKMKFFKSKTYFNE